MEWFQALEVFVKVAEFRSFVKAARQLRLTTSRVTKLVQTLERQLKLTLLVRTTRQVTLTEDGEYLFVRAASLLKEWDELRHSLLDQNQCPQGLIQIAAPADLLSSAPMTIWLSDFLKNNPAIKINTRLLIKPVNLAEENIDVLIGVDRFVLNEDHVVAKPILHFKSLVYASPHYLKQHPKLNHPTDLAYHNCLLFRDENRWTFSTGKQKVQGNYAADSAMPLFTAALDGLGLIKVPDFMVAEWVRKKRLLPLLSDYQTAQENLNVYYQKKSYQPRKIQLLVEHLLTCAMQHDRSE